jgi:hypothetical protein
MRQRRSRGWRRSVTLSRGIAVFAVALVAAFAARAQLKGDVNGDGSVNLRDLVLLVSDQAGVRPLAPNEVEPADVAPTHGPGNPGDGEIGVSDLAVFHRGLRSTADIDGDNLDRSADAGVGTSLFDEDTDDDGLGDGFEIAHDLDPLNPGSGNIPPHVPALSNVSGVSSKIVATASVCDDEDGIPEACEVRVVVVAQGASCTAAPIGVPSHSGSTWTISELELFTTYTVYAIADDGLHETCSAGVEVETSDFPPAPPTLSNVAGHGTDITATASACVDDIPGACEVRVIAVAQGASCTAPRVGRPAHLGPAGSDWSVRGLELFTQYTVYALADDGVYDEVCSAGVDVSTNQERAHFIISGDTQTLSLDPSIYTFVDIDEEHQWTDLHERLCDQIPRIQHVIGTGDIVYHVDSGSPELYLPQFALAAQAFNLLDACGIGYSLPAGNHDLGPDPTYDPQPYLDFVNARPVSHWEGVVVGANTGFYVRHLFDKYYLVVLPHRYTDSGADDAVEAYIQANPAKRFILVHHDSVFALPDEVIQFPTVRGFVERNANIVGIISGHRFGVPRTWFGIYTAFPGREMLRVGSNFQDFEASPYTYDVFAQWWTRMTFYPVTREFCFTSQNAYTGARHLFSSPPDGLLDDNDEFCWSEPPPSP